MTSKRNGAYTTPETSLSPFLAMMQAPFAGVTQSPFTHGIVLSQRLSQEAMRFWVRRMRAYADQLEALASCADATQMVTTQASFIERLQEDYAEERAAVTDILRATEAAEGMPEGRA